MEYINSILGSQGQTQSVEEAIPTLCNRLQHAALVSDRRSAVLGLKSFSRQYRETVVEYGLKPLISTLKKDYDNTNLVKSILETFLILFIRGDTNEDLTRGWISQQSRLQNGKYPSPLLMDYTLDQMSLWIADALLQDQDAFKLLVDELDENDYHLRVYTIQLLESLVASRGTRVKEALLNVPTSMSTICNLLQDIHEPVRNEAILLLMAVVNNNFNIQKLVAFENTFETLFNIIDEEGGIRGSILVQDCLTLITNLLQFNASNQKFFLETQCVPRLAKLLGEPIDETEEAGNTDEDYDGNGSTFPSSPMVWTEQRLQNMIIALEICRLLVSEDNELVVQNQDNLYQNGIHYILLKLVFSPITEISVRSVALLATADAISGNPTIQFEISKIDVPYIDPSLPSHLQAYDKPISVPLAWLNWCLLLNSVHLFDIRIGAAYCLQSYFKHNQESKMAFLNDQISAYSDDEFYRNLKEDLPLMNGNSIRTPFGNVFKVLMDYDSDLKLNPYKVWFAAVILMYAFEDEPANRDLARAVKTGDADSGEEVMTSVQAISGLLITTLTHMDQRIAIGYLMLLTVWLYEDFNAVNDFLNDGSIVKSLLNSLSHSSIGENSLVHGMTTVLLGVVYEFSTKESPITRTELHALLVKSLGRDNYSLKVKQLVADPVFKFFDETSNFSSVQDDSGLPDVYFDVIYVNLVKENSFRIKRALFHDPEGEPRRKISYEDVEELDLRISELKKEIHEEKQKNLESESTMRSKIKELETLKEDVQSRLVSTEDNLQKLKADHETAKENIASTSQSLEEVTALKNKYESSSVKLQKDLDSSLKRLEVLEAEKKRLEASLNQAESAKEKLESGVNTMTKDLFQLKKQNNDSESKIKKLEKDTKTIQNEFEKVKRAKEDEINKLKKEIESVNQRLVGQENEHMRATATIESLTRDLNSKDSDISKAKQEVVSLKSRVEELDRVKTQLTKTLEEKQSEIQTSQSKIDSGLDEQRALKTEVEKLNTKLQSAREKLVQFESDSDEKIHKLEHELEDYSSKVKKLQEEVIKLNTRAAQIPELEKSNKDLEDQVSKLRAELNANEKTISELNDVKNASTKMSKEVKGLKEEHQRAQNELLAKIKTYEEELKAAKQKLGVAEEASTKVKTLSSDVQNLKSKLEQAQSELTEKSLDVDTGNAAKKKVLELEKDLAKLRDQLEKSKEDGVKSVELSQKVEKLKAQVESGKELESTNKEFEKTIEKLTKDLETKQSKIEEGTKLKKVVEELQIDLAKAKKQGDRGKELQQENERLKKELDQAQKSVKSGLDLQTENKDVKNELEKAQKEKNDLNKVQKENDSLRKEVDGLKKQSDEFEKLKKEMEKLNAELAESKKQKDEILELKEKNQKLSTELEDSNKKEQMIFDLQSEKDKVKKELEDARKNQSDAQEWETKVENLESELQDNKKQILDATAFKTKAETLIKEQTAQMEEIEKLKKENESLVTSVQLEKENARKSTKRTDEIAQIKQKHKEEIQEMEKRIKSLEDKYSSFVPKSDLDDLMLLMSDLDDKNKVYKSRLKKLGETVASDESSDDEGDDDDDDDDDDEE
ncbi:USO1 [Candida theae]|uniref:USO1 n=1 Tax=Candida theae TaxID=1198502 RepID=A0AAD5BGB4_9ASCO|nr:USO1 [Candida theae]KAI5959330.1 USO1 [Candida theae]